MHKCLSLKRKVDCNFRVLQPFFYFLLRLSLVAEMAAKRARTDTSTQALAQQFLAEFDEDDEVSSSAGSRDSAGANAQQAALNASGTSSAPLSVLFRKLPDSCLRVALSFLNERECR